MARGGARPGAGRKNGTANKKTRAIAEAALENGITPLDYMLQVMRQEVPEDVDFKTRLEAQMLRFEAAKAAAPYVHPRLAAVEHSGKGGGPVQVNIAGLDVGVL